MDAFTLGMLLSPKRTVITIWNTGETGDIHKDFPDPVCCRQTSFLISFSTTILFILSSKYYRFLEFIFQRTLSTTSMQGISIFECFFLGTFRTNSWVLNFSRTKFFETYGNFRRDMGRGGLDPPGRASKGGSGVFRTLCLGA